MKISAVLLAVWYCLSIIGFGVHTCQSSGQTFIAMFTDGASCSDIHPEHHCCKTKCHEQSQCDADCSIELQKCCSNEYHMIQLSGCLSSVESDLDAFKLEMLSTYVSLQPVYVSYGQLYTEDFKFWNSDSGDVSPCDPQVTFGVWRV